MKQSVLIIICLITDRYTFLKNHFLKIIKDFFVLGVVYRFEVGYS